MVGTYSDLKDQLLAIVLGLNGVENGRELVTLELDCTRKSDIIHDGRFGSILRVVVMDSGAGKDFREPDRPQGLHWEWRTYHRRRHQ